MDSNKRTIAVVSRAIPEIQEVNGYPAVVFRNGEGEKLGHITSKNLTTFDTDVVGAGASKGYKSLDDAYHGVVLRLATCHGCFVFADVPALLADFENMYPHQTDREWFDSIAQIHGEKFGINDLEGLISALVEGAVELRAPEPSPDYQFSEGGKPYSVFVESKELELRCAGEYIGSIEYMPELDCFRLNAGGVVDSSWGSVCVNRLLERGVQVEVGPENPNTMTVFRELCSLVNGIRRDFQEDTNNE